MCSLKGVWIWFYSWGKSLVIPEAQSRFRKLARSFLGTVTWKGWDWGLMSCLSKSQMGWWPEWRQLRWHWRWWAGVSNVKLNWIGLHARLKLAGSRRGAWWSQWEMVFSVSGADLEMVWNQEGLRCLWPCPWCEWSLQDRFAGDETGLELLSCSFIHSTNYSVLGTVLSSRVQQWTKQTKILMVIIRNRDFELIIGCL